MKIHFMKKLGLYIIILCVIFAKTSFSQPQAAEVIVSNALSQAATQHKNVIIIFHASWCVWCGRLDASLNDKKIKHFFDDQYVIAHMVINESKGKETQETPGANVYLTKWGGESQGLPYWVILDATGQIKATSMYKAPGKTKEDNIGCPAAPDEVAYFLAILEKTSSLTKKQLAKIKQRFNKNEISR